MEENETSQAMHHVTFTNVATRLHDGNMYAL